MNNRSVSHVVRVGAGIMGTTNCLRRHVLYALHVSKSFLLPTASLPNLLLFSLAHALVARGYQLSPVVWSQAEKRVFSGENR